MSVRPSRRSSFRRCPSSVRPSARRRRPSSVRPLSVRPVVRLIITSKRDLRQNRGKVKNMIAR